VIKLRRDAVEDATFDLARVDECTADPHKRYFTTIESYGTDFRICISRYALNDADVLRDLKLIAWTRCRDKERENSTVKIDLCVCVCVCVCMCVIRESTQN